MLKLLKLKKVVYAIILGVLAFIVAHIMNENKVDGSAFVLAVSGVFLSFNDQLNLHF